MVPVLLCVARHEPELSAIAGRELRDVTDDGIRVGPNAAVTNETGERAGAEGPRRNLERLHDGGHRSAAGNDSRRIEDGRGELVEPAEQNRSLVEGHRLG